MMRTNLVSNKFEKLFYQNYENLCNVAYQYVMNRFIAEDIVQETFIRFWEKKRTSLPEDEAVYYLTRAVRNNCITHLRQSVAHIPFDDILTAVTLNVAQPEDETDDDPRLDLLEKAIGDLPPKCREIFLLAKMEQKKYREIAEMLCISIKTVENQMGKAIAVLRSAFADGNQLCLLCAVLLSFFLAL